jgi:L-cystine uptake protein TcyP (sodium:dicarboxylate symporter family)
MIMITNCLPFSIWISVMLSGLVFLILGASLKWSELDDFLNLCSWYLIISMAVFLAFSVIPVQTQVNSIKVFLRYTPTETFAMTNRIFLCSLPKGTGTNGFAYIKQINILNFHEVVLKTTYSY